jgi:hypothetical protein
VVILILLLLIFPVALHAEEPAQLQAVIYDPTSPKLSVGIVNNTLLEVGDTYEFYTVLSFDPEAIILRDEITTESVKWVIESEPNAALKKNAYYTFITKKLHAINEAQAEYFKLYRHYADSFESLAKAGVLPDHFIDAADWGYDFHLKMGKTERFAMVSERLPTYSVLASPKDPKDYFFSIDHLAQVRYAPSEKLVHWGPVWDYSDQSIKELSHFIGLETATR